MKYSRKGNNQQWQKEGIFEETASDINTTHRDLQEIKLRKAGLERSAIHSFLLRDHRSKQGLRGINSTGMYKKKKRGKSRWHRHTGNKILKNG